VAEPPAIAIVGMACRYPDAASPAELWRNVLARRRAFRPVPDVRLPLGEYGDAVDADRTYVTHAAVLEGYEFDRSRYRIAADTFRQTDLAHWLALDVAGEALRDAGFEAGRDPRRPTTAVFVGNTLTGELSRAGALRLRWPYVRRLLDGRLGGAGGEVLARLEADFKRPFPAMGADSLAGALSSTIAGRICNHFDLGGGGYVVDGACASSLLAVATGCSALCAGDADLVLAGGVDVSLDPFELVGFARLGALARTAMRVYDERSEGFWPGEGCGFVVLARLEDAVTLGLAPYAVIRGWGVASDGRGGITRPEVRGQRAALERAYRRAGFGAETVALFEGHGTGTVVGDRVEVEALGAVRAAGGARPVPAVIGTIKANIGHTKAAAGAAGLIKAAMALRERVLPPTTGCDRPIAGVAPGGSLAVSGDAVAWPAGRPLRAGVSAFGFGGIDVHLALEGGGATRRRRLRRAEVDVAASEQDCELFLFAADDAGELSRQVADLLAVAPALSMAELGDAAAGAAGRLRPGRLRAAAVAGSGAELAERLASLLAGAGEGRPAAPPRVGFLFPGQGTPAAAGGLLPRRFAAAREVFARAGLEPDPSSTDTALAQPAVVTASVAALRVLRWLGVTAAAAAGHSLGELVAYHWAGALGDEALLAVARARGRAMAAVPGPAGAMLAVRASREETAALLSAGAVVACLNAPLQTVVAGAAAEVANVARRARARGLAAQPLAVAHAFHSPLMSPAAPALSRLLAELDLRPLQAPVVSTVTGGELAPDADLRCLLVEQLTGPVRFVEAVTALAGRVDVLVEVGAAGALARLAAETAPLPVFGVDATGPSLRGLLDLLACLYTRGTPIRHDRLFRGRHVKPLAAGWRPRFIASPCGRGETSAEEPPHRPSPTGGAGSYEVLRDLVCARTELPPGSVGDGDRLLSDLHLNSITVAELVVEAARRLGRRPPRSTLELAGASLAEAAVALDRLPAADPAADAAPPAGAAPWVRAFAVETIEEPGPHPDPPPEGGGARRGGWALLGAGDHPLGPALERLVADLPGAGLLVAVDREPGPGLVARLLAGAGAAISERKPAVFVQERGAGLVGGFARSLFLEAGGPAVTVVGVPFADGRAAGWVARETLWTTGFREVEYDGTGRRLAPALRALEPAPPGGPLLGPRDVLLVSGGSAGIGAECAHALARATGCAVALLGRTHPAATLARLAGAGLRARAATADVTDPAAVAAAVAGLEAELGPVTALLHAAGVNEPARLRDLDEARVAATLAPKLGGLEALLAALDGGGLRLLVGFGSVIARTGLDGEAHYALANEWLRRGIERFAAEHPACRCRCLEWSVWSGTGMGERLGTVDLLRGQGVAPIGVEEGAGALLDVLATGAGPTSVVVSSRLDGIPTLRFAPEPPPLLRFLERVEVHYPGVEIVVDAELDGATDPYLRDHALGGELLLPAVVGLEAMAQAAGALVRDAGDVVFRDVRFERPVVVPGRGARRLRIAATRASATDVAVAIRSDATGLAADHFRATCRFGTARPPGSTLPPPVESAVDLDPGRDLYGSLLFQTGRFRRLRGYRALTARACAAEVWSEPDGDWFARHLPERLLLGDPGARDATVHALQACLPHLVVVPAAVEEIWIGRPCGTAGPRYVRAAERTAAARSVTWDLEVRDRSGAVVERWRGLRLDAVEERRPTPDWHPALLAICAERGSGRA
jgi:enediyne polyketide synthase